MSAEHVVDPAPGYSDPDPAPQVLAEYASWGTVTAPSSEHPWPTLVLGNDERELHLALDRELLDDLLVKLAGHAEDSDDSTSEDVEMEERRPLTRRLGSKAVSASGWPVTSRWWRSAESNTRIIVAGIIAAVMVLGLLVTF